MLKKLNNYIIGKLTEYKTSNFSKALHKLNYLDRQKKLQRERLTLELHKTLNFHTVKE